MARTRFTVDIEHLLVALIALEMPHCVVAAAPDVDAVDRLPLIIIAPGQGVAIQGQRELAWTWATHFQVLAGDDETASDLADELYEKLDKFADSWDPAVGMIAGVGAITNVEDISMFSRTVTTVTPAGGLTQFDGTFAITVRKA